jgi:hypothetical protein
MTPYLVCPPLNASLALYDLKCFGKVVPTDLVDELPVTMATDEAEVDAVDIQSVQSLLQNG